jgi:hypothetical protein
MQELFLPNLDYWNYGNQWSGSLENLRFWVTPQEGQFMVEAWPGPMNRQNRSQVTEAAFPLDENGLKQMHAWLMQQLDEIQKETE